MAWQARGYEPVFSLAAMGREKIRSVRDLTCHLPFADDIQRPRAKVPIRLVPALHRRRHLAHAKPATAFARDARFYYLGDANFNVTTLVDTAGDAIERYVYSPYGVITAYDATWSNIRSNSIYDNEYTDTGRRLDKENGIYQYRHRCYHAGLGRFCSRDPVGYEGGSCLFQYTEGSPIAGLDPTGTACIVYYDCTLIAVRKTSMFVKECVYACSESKKRRKDLPGGGEVDCKDARIPIHVVLPRAMARGLCTCDSEMKEYAKAWDNWGGFMDCDKEECLQTAKDAAKKARESICTLMPPAAKQACKAWWTAWEQEMVALCSKCTGKKS